jgi:hypothetical protein
MGLPLSQPGPSGPDFLTRKGGRNMAKIRKRRIRWNQSNGQGGSEVVGYRLYWATGGEVNYNSDHMDLGMRTEVVLPDDIPSLPDLTGDIELGVSALSEIGNESDIIKFPETIRFVAPESPVDLVVESVQDFYVHPKDEDRAAPSDQETVQSDESNTAESETGY